MSGGDVAQVIVAASGWITAAVGLVQSRWQHQDAHDQAVKVITDERDKALRAVERLEGAVTAKAAESALKDGIIARQTAELDSLRDRVSDLERLLYARGAAS